MRALLAAIAVALVALTATSTAQALVLPELPLNDFEVLLTLTGGQFTQPMGPVQTAPHPTLKPVPRADCGPGSRPLNGMQGRVSTADVNSPAAAQGWTCNTTQLGRFPTPGGFRTWRYVDRNNHVCAYYDTSFPSPGGLISLLGGPSSGVVVLDMSDPTHPVETTTLTTLAMLAPHESLNLNAKRGLLAAEVGNGLTLPGSFAIYDISQDCRRPVLQSQLLTVFGHESGFSPDGETYWVAGGAGEVNAIDVSNPKLPHVVWQGNMYSHGLNLSADGNTLFHTDPINGNLGILDVNEVQARKPNPKVRQLSRVTWDTVSIPQNSIPITVKGHSYLIEFDEFAFRFNPVTIEDKAGAARIFDIDDLTKPKIVSDLRLEVNMRDAHVAAAGDPSPLPGPLTYAAHYCGVPREVDPGIVACSFINSGLRVFDIRDPAKPREVAYFVAPPKAGTVAGFLAGNAAMSQPVFDSAKRQVWYTDATSGLYVLRLSDAAWPQPTTCRSPARLTITLRKGLRSAHVRYAGRNAHVVKSRGRLRARLDLRGLAAETVTVRTKGTTTKGRRVTQTRRIVVC